ncbi:hypothetical protein N657DRAFT_646196 [Parathielavia appendiculata]|uniref:Uncharacterized protein n=1 Tax=Parathielavia appendiculata TaxID=2587402 RepID=A0AAN6Z306_9PEZI|nr:hypothetical protein N657DRAFT_646196 [Parathielavia appendiculata]
MSDTSSLADSAYEVIQVTDNESQYGGLTESTCSLSAPRPDDVHSLDGSQDHYNTDSEEESDHSSHASSIRYADQTLQNPSTQLSATRNLEYGPSTGGSGVVVRSIECQETASALLSGQISAKHVIREFGEDESSAISRNLGLPNRSKHLVASIRQTLSPSYLAMNEPFRVLYVGQADTQRTIVLKICDAIWVSPKDGSHEQDYFNRHREGLYNIVPISSFGPTPELDLMETSRYQIRVEHCTSAEASFEEGQPDIVYSITLDQERSHRSCFSPSHDPVVHPKWNLPHIAVFYLSEIDDADAERTRDITCDFMERHGVPCLFIADRQDLDHPCWQDYVDQHAIHLCLESRDPEMPMQPRLFPIDLASFEDIDARQMNRNLAFLTGMSEAEDTAFNQCAVSTKPLSMLDSALSSVRRAWPLRTEPHFSELSISSVLHKLMVMIIPLVLLALVRWLQPESSHHMHPSSSTGVCVSMQTHSVVFTTSKSSSVATSTKTVVINVTSTKTVEVSRAKPSTSTLASVLSFAGFLPEKPSIVPADIEPKKPANSSKKTVCSVRVYSPTEFLVAVPTRNKVVWLAQGAIDIAVRRDEETIKSKISSVDEGVLVELDRKDAHGVLNVSVVTSRRPKINETFQVDFGKSAVVEALDAGLHMLQDALRKVPWTDDARQVFEHSRSLPHDVVSALERASEAVRERATGTMKRASDIIREHLARQLKSAEAMRKEADLSVLQAQVASKLWWFKMQGKMEEYAEYQRNASRFIKNKHDELVNARKGKEKTYSKKARLFHGFRSGAYVPWKEDCDRRGEAVKDSGSREGGRGTRWRKFMRGM